MNYSQIGTAFRIWLIALAFNTMLGTIWLTVFEGFYSQLVLLLIYGTLFGAAVSAPALFIMWLVINYCCRWRLSYKQMLRAALIASVLSGTIAWVLYVEWMGNYREVDFLLLAIVSGVTSTLTQRRSFKRLSVYEEKTLLAE